MKFDFDSIEPISARAVEVVEEGVVEVIIKGYRFSFTIHEYSSKIVNIYLDNNCIKARNMLKEFGVSFKKETKDKIHGEEFESYIFDVYQKSNSEGGMFCAWSVKGYNDIEYKEF